MRRLSCILLSILLSVAAAAQKHVRFSGYVQMAGDPLISYYLELDIKGTNVSGYSITGYKDGNRLKAAVTGNFTTSSDLYIRETSSLDAQPNLFSAYCYFSAHLKLTILMTGQQRWNGPFESYQANGTPCGGGIMTITDKAPPLDEAPKLKPATARVETPKPPIPILHPKPELPKPQPLVVQKPKDTTRLKPVIIVRQEAKAEPAAPPDSCQRSYDWNGDEFAFDIWDGWTIDGDVVSLSMSGRSLLQRMKLSETKQHFTMPLTKGLNVLYIYLHEEGFDPPNTPNLTLYDGSKKYELSVSGNNGEVARICIWRR